MQYFELIYDLDTPLQDAIRHQYTRDSDTSQVLRRLQSMHP